MRQAAREFLGSLVAGGLTALGGLAAASGSLGGLWIGLWNLGMALYVAEVTFEGKYE